ncbi:MAG: autotransporter domain-containing protein, partial [Candidatus Accumulibacter sp.]|nr:autotransporter domain-containing protein [Accumulibacter sp.]
MTGNTVNLNSGAVDFDVYGGYSSGSGAVTGNTVNLNSGTVGLSVFGGSSYSGRANGNTVEVHGGGASTVYGGFISSGAGNADSNSITMTNGGVNSLVGAYVTSGDATHNTVSLSGGTVSLIVSGGYSASGGATGNTVNLSGGTVTIAVYGGQSTSGTATHNTVNLSGGTVNAVFGGSCTSSCSDIFTANTLNVRVAGNSVGALANFENLNFTLDSTVAANDVILTVGTATLGSGGNQSKIGIEMNGSAPLLKSGDEVKLISATTSLSTNGIPAQAQALAGSTINYNFDLKQTGNDLIAKFSHVAASQQSKSLSEGYLSGTSFLSQGADFLLGKGLAAARTAVAEGNQNRPEVFAALGYGKIHNQTGSSVAVKGYNLVTGLAFGRRLENTNLTGAFFFEYGNGDYNSYNSFSTGKVQGRGDTGYKGIGVLARSDFNNGVHIEGSLRGGKVDSDYRSNELVDNQGNRARYDTKTGYLGAHIGAGKRWELNTQDSIETYAQGIWTRQSGESARLSTGERLKFQEIDSKRIRIGTRVTHAMSGTLKAYAGLAIEREFGGEAKATTNGYKIDAPKLKG